MSNIAASTSSLPVAIGRGLYNLFQEGNLANYWRQMQSRYRFSQLSFSIFLPNIGTIRDLKRLARQAVSYRMYNDLDLHILRWNACTVINGEVVDQLVAQKQGAIFCTQHLGPYRRISSELLARGMKVNVVADQNFLQNIWPFCFERVRESLAARQIAIENLSEIFHIINAEEIGAARKILRALKHKEAVLIYMDGNTGVGGQEDTSKHGVCVEFFGRQIWVRKGVCHLAYTAQVPIIPVFTYWQGLNQPMMQVLPPLLPSSADTVETFCQTGQQQLYQTSEEWIKRYPDQYEEWVRAHRWLASNNQSISIDANPNILKELYTQIQQEISDQTIAYQASPAQLMVLNLDNERLMIDRTRGKIFKVRPLTEKLVTRLYQTTPAKQLISELQKESPLTQIVGELVRLKHLGLLQVHNAKI